MGEFEDLIAQAKGGDLSALDTLGTKYSGTALRDQAETVPDLKKQLEEQRPLVMQAKFSNTIGELPEGFDISDLHLEDLGVSDPNEITPELLQAKAVEKAAIKETQQMTLATEAGFATVEDFNRAMNVVKQQQLAKQATLEQVGGATASTGGSITPSEGEKSNLETMVDSHKAAKSQGATDDVALADAIHDSFAKQSPAGENV